MSLIILWSAIFILAIICLCLKKKIRWLATLVLVLTVTFFTLLTKEGKVLWEFGSFHITLGALKAGLFRSGVLVFLQLLSKTVISSDLRLPGKAGRFITEVFSVYEKLTAGNFIVKNSPHGKIDSLVQAVDQRLLSVWDDDNL